MTKIVITAARTTILDLFDTIVRRRDGFVAYLTIAAPVSGVGFGQLDFSVTENSGLGALMGY